MDIEDLERHPDPSDTAADIAAKKVMEGIGFAQQFKGPLATGLCLSCEAQLVDDETLAAIRAGTAKLDEVRRFCGGWCRDDWQAEQDRLKRVGRHG